MFMLTSTNYDHTLRTPPRTGKKSAWTKDPIPKSTRTSLTPPALRQPGFFNARWKDPVKRKSSSWPIRNAMLRILDTERRCWRLIGNSLRPIKWMSTNSPEQIKLNSINARIVQLTRTKSFRKNVFRRGNNTLIEYTLGVRSHPGSATWNNNSTVLVCLGKPWIPMASSPSALLEKGLQRIFHPIFSLVQCLSQVLCPYSRGETT